MMASSSSSSTQDETACDTLSSISMSSDRSFTILTPPSTPPSPPTSLSPDQVLSSFPMQDNTKTIYVRNLGPDVEPNYIRDLFRPYGYIKGLRVIWEGYVDTIAFIEYEDQRSAEKAMSVIDQITKKSCEDCHGNGNETTTMTVRGGDACYDIGYETKDADVADDHGRYGNGKVTMGKTNGGFTIFIGNTENLKEVDLSEAFKPFGNIKRLLLLKRDKRTGRSQGFAFVTYTKQSSAEKAIKEMNGAVVKNTIICVEWDRGRKPKEKKPKEIEKALEKLDRQMEYDKISKDTTDTSPDSTTVFVGNAYNLTEKDLIEAFQRFGRIRRVFMMPDQSFGFVTYANESSAEDAIRAMDGARVKNTTLCVQWEYRRNATEKKTRVGKNEELELERQRECDKNVSKAEDKTRAEKVEEMEREGRREFYYDEISKQSSPENTTIFCCYKQGILTNQILRQKFSPFGKITGLKCYTDEGYGFIRFQERSSAIRAIYEKNGAKTSKGGVVLVGWGNGNTF